MPGSKIKPSIPYISFGVAPGRNIMHDNAMDESNVRRAFGYGELLANSWPALSDLVVVGESIAGGTTTTLAVLIALGIDAKFKVSRQHARKPTWA